MNKLIRLTSGFLCLGLLVLGITISQLACPLRWNGGKRASLADERGREAKLLQSFEALRRHREAKRQVAQEVMAQRRSLAQAIEQFQALDREWPELPSNPQTPEELGISAEE